MNKMTQSKEIIKDLLGEPLKEGDFVICIDKSQFAPEIIMDIKITPKTQKVTTTSNYRTKSPYKMIKVTKAKAIEFIINHELEWYYGGDRTAKEVIQKLENYYLKVKDKS